VEDVGEWLRGGSALSAPDGFGREVRGSEPGERLFGSSWTREEIAMEIGAVLKLKDREGESYNILSQNLY
jgi:hypothetical protein